MFIRRTNKSPDMLKRENTTHELTATSVTKEAIASPKYSYKKAFKKAMALKLGVKYKAIKNLFPECLNSTLIANHLQPVVLHFSHEEIRNISQQLKLQFDEFQ